MINELNLRARRHGEKLSETETQGGGSWYDFKKRLGAIDIKLQGRIGQCCGNE